MIENFGPYIGMVVSAAISGGLTWIVTLRSTKRQAEADAMASVQNVYQELIDDLKKDRDELRVENQNLKNELRDLHSRQDKLEEQCRENSRKVEAMLPWICYCKNCPTRQSTAQK